MKSKYLKIIYIVAFFGFVSCHQSRQKYEIKDNNNSTEIIREDTVIIDCHYTFQQAIAGTKAPRNVIDELELINVEYYSTDNKIHKGQILTNKKIASDLSYMFRFMLKNKFSIHQAIPVVKYKWQDDLSMQDNNTYSFCFRNQDFSKHATGMAIDINPYFNPMRWKEKFEYRQDRPFDAPRDTTINGTFYVSHPVVQEFFKQRFLWGHNFKMKFDDHHFEK